MPPTTWRNALARVIACPTAVAIGDYLFAGVQFAAPSQWIAVGLAMATLSMVLDVLFEDRLRWWGSALLFTVVVAAIIHRAPDLMARVETTRPGAIGVGVLLGLVEVIMHWSLFGAPGLVPGWRPGPID